VSRVRLLILVCTPSPPPTKDGTVRVSVGSSFVCASFVQVCPTVLFTTKACHWAEAYWICAGCNQSIASFHLCTNPPPEMSARILRGDAVHPHCNCFLFPKAPFSWVMPHLPGLRCLRFCPLFLVVFWRSYTNVHSFPSYHRIALRFVNTPPRWQRHPRIA
jgi:hypothetical protein